VRERGEKWNSPEEEGEFQKVATVPKTKEGASKADVDGNPVPCQARLFRSLSGFWECS
jgi:hypothetical protein